MSQIHIIIIDDDSSIRILCKEMLAMLYPMATFSMMGDCLEFINNFETYCSSADNTMILIDNQMGTQMSGVTAIEQLRALGCTSPIVMMSGGDFEKAAMRAGANAFLAKPLTFTKISSVVSKYL